jgi:hypothetical protein
MVACSYRAIPSICKDNQNDCPIQFTISYFSRMESGEAQFHAVKIRSSLESLNKPLDNRSVSRVMFHFVNGCSDDLIYFYGSKCLSQLL